MVKAWLDEQYPAIAECAKTEDAEIHWGDETAVVNTDVRGQGYQPKGPTPVAYAVGGTRHKLSMISTVTNQGKTRWMIVDDAFNSDKLIEFLAVLIKEADKKLFLILDNLRVHHSKPVKAWLAERKDQIEVFYLPSYIPELTGATPPWSAASVLGQVGVVLAVPRAQNTGRSSSLSATGGLGCNRRAWASRAATVAASAASISPGWMPLTASSA